MFDPDSETPDFDLAARGISYLGRVLWDYIGHFGVRPRFSRGTDSEHQCEHLALNCEHFDGRSAGFHSDRFGLEWTIGRNYLERKWRSRWKCRSWNGYYHQFLSQ